MGAAAHLLLPGGCSSCLKNSPCNLPLPVTFLFRAVTLCILQDALHLSLRHLPNFCSHTLPALPSHFPLGWHACPPAPNAVNPCLSGAGSGYVFSEKRHSSGGKLCRFLPFTRRRCAWRGGVRLRPLPSVWPFAALSPSVPCLPSFCSAPVRRQSFFAVFSVRCRAFH